MNELIHRLIKKKDDIIEKAMDECRTRQKEGGWRC